MIMPLHEYLEQDEMWISAEKGPSKISDMTPDHRMLAARWLFNHATPLISIVEATYHEDVVGEIRGLPDVLSLVAQNPRDWIMNTKLYRALAMT